MAAHLNNIEIDKLYEMWIFFQILEILKPVKQIHENKSLFRDEYGVSVEYHKQLDIGWILEKAGGFTSGVKRYPDITISKSAKHSIIVDAKCMQLNTSITFFELYYYVASEICGAIRSKYVKVFRF